MRFAPLSQKKEEQALSVYNQIVEKIGINPSKEQRQSVEGRKLLCQNFCIKVSLGDMSTILPERCLNDQVNFYGN